MTTWANNRQATFRYEILDKFEAGIELTGAEVKSVKAGRVNLSGAYVIIRGGEAYLTNADIAPYQPASVKAGQGTAGYDTKRLRRLLLNKKEIATLTNADGKSGLTIIPLNLYSKGRLVKLGLAIARGKKQYDKRETTKKREAKRQIERTLKDF